MSTFDLLFCDPFIRGNSVGEYLCNKKRMAYIEIGHLFGKLVYVNGKYQTELGKGNKSYYSVFEEIVVSELSGYNILIPDYPKFLDSLENLKTLIDTLKKHGYESSQIWYVSNTNLKGTIAQSLKMKYGIEPAEAKIRTTLENALKIQTRQKEIIYKLSSLIKVQNIHSDNMLVLPESTKKQINELAI
jgi:hypothetical protein